MAVTTTVPPGTVTQWAHPDWTTNPPIHIQSLFRAAQQKMCSALALQDKKRNRRACDSHVNWLCLCSVLSIHNWMCEGARSSSPCSATSGPPPTNRCCDSGRPLFTDPTTGQTICSCQHEQMLNYQRIAQASLMGPAGMPLSMYNSAAYAEGLPATYIPGVGPDQSHFYPNLVSNQFIRFRHFSPAHAPTNARASARAPVWNVFGRSFVNSINPEFEFWKMTKIKKPHKMRRVHGINCFEKWEFCEQNM